MILTSHIIVGGLLAGQLSTYGGSITGMSNYFFQAAISLASHYLLDMVPHWEYPIGEFKRISETRELQLAKKTFWFDLAKVGADALIGFSILFLSGYFLEIGWKSLIIGGIFGILPDSLSFLSWFSPSGVLQTHNKFHQSIHTKLKPGPLAGAITQIIAIAIIFALFAKK